MTPSYEFYAGVCNGTMAREDYEEVAEQATSFVDYVIFPKVPKGECQLMGYNRAICRVCDVFSQMGVYNAGSFSIGKFSMSGAEDPKSEAINAAMQELFPVGLGFGGIA